MERISAGLGGNNCESIQRREDPEFSLREWGLKARMVSRDNTLSRRFSASQAVTSFREDPLHRSFRSNFTISSTASSPGFGYTLKDEIDPSTYSFTNALKALQLRSINTWEYLSPEIGMTLNSKWYEAEKYISNPLSGEVPMECLSAKTLVGSGGGGSRTLSKRLLSGRFTMSAPLIYPSSHDSRRHFPNPPIQEKWNEERNGVDHKTRDVGTQSTVLAPMSKGYDADDVSSPIVTSSSRSPPSPSASTPPIQERSIKCNLALQGTINSSHSSSDDSSSNSNSKSDHHEGEVELMKGGGGGEETERNGSEEMMEGDNNGGDDNDGESRQSSSSCFSCSRKKKGKNKAEGASCLCMCMMDKQGAGASCINYYSGCLSLRNLWVRRRRTTRTGHADRDLEQA